MFRYETHLHTQLGSCCSWFQPQEIVEKYVNLGYWGVFVTDHFLNGNTTVPQNLPWKERIWRFTEGYRAVKEAAEGRLDVFFGLESSYDGTDFLIYGLGPDWLVRHPEIMEMRTSDLCQFFRMEGALVIQAHPYRQAFYIDHIRLYPSCIDGMETLNTNIAPWENKFAKTFAETYNLRQTAGSDIHGKNQQKLAGMEFDSALTSEQDFVERVLRGEGRLFTLTDRDAK